MFRRSNMLDKRKFYINGEWVNPAKSNDFSVINPATERPIAIISLGGEADTNSAVSAAKNAFENWSMTSKQERIDLLDAIFEEYKRRASDMAQAISTEMGAPITMATNQQVSSGLSQIEIFISELKKFSFEHEIDTKHPSEIIRHEAIGVCGLITPWNWPMNQICLKVIPAIAVGCAVVLKPSEISPLSAHIFSEIMDAAGCPAGVYNHINGDGLGVGSQLSRHKDVDMISFTGSTRAGIEITKSAGETIKRVTLELGGKGANIVFADADKDAVSRGILQVFNNSGQSCNAPTRMLVERSIYDRSVVIAAEIAKNYPVDISSKAGSHMGPVVSKVQFDKIQNLIKTGINEGARLIAGGLGRVEGLEKGYFVRPTIFADVDNSMTISQEEIFGPVIVMIPFDDEAEALKISNDTVYGLTNYIQSSDVEKVKRMARGLRSGMVRINGDLGSAASPFGGYKQSGNGREGGKWGLEDFLEIKHITGWKI